MKQLSAVPEVLGLEERRAVGRPIAACSLEARLDDEHSFGEGQEVALLVQDLPVLDQRESIRDGVGVLRKQALLENVPAVDQERSEPGREEEHLAAKEVDP